MLQWINSGIQGTKYSSFIVATRQFNITDEFFKYFQDVWHCEICNRKPGRGFGKFWFLGLFLRICPCSIYFLVLFCLKMLPS